MQYRYSMMMVIFEQKIQWEKGLYHIVFFKKKEKIIMAFPISLTSLESLVRTVIF